jgi:hypothetical protein
MINQSPHNLTPVGAAFMARWLAKYPDSAPIGHSLKHHFSPRWMRFHSLPNGQRYARSKGESDTILMRQNKIIDSLIPWQAKLEIVLSRLEHDCHLFQSCNLMPLGAFQDVALEVPIQAWLMDDVWEPGGLDIILTMVAGDQARAVILGPDCLIAPYDGGVDVILKDAFTAHALKRQFSDWVSPREDGL